MIDHFLTLDLRLRREHGTRWGSSIREASLWVLWAVELVLLNLQHFSWQFHNWLRCCIIASCAAVIKLILSGSIDISSQTPSDIVINCICVDGVWCTWVWTRVKTCTISCYSCRKIITIAKQMHFSRRSDRWMVHTEIACCYKNTNDLQYVRVL